MRRQRRRSARPPRHASACASLPDRPCPGNLCDRTSTRSAPGCVKGAPTPGSPTSSRSPCATSSSSSARTSSSATRRPAEGAAGGDYPEEIDLRAEDDALIAAELEAAEAEAERARAEAERAKAEADDSDEEDPEDDGEVRPRRRSRRGGRGRRSGSRNSGPLEGTFDHGEEGYGLWLDPAIQENAIYAEHWAGHRPVEVEVEEDRIVIRRVALTTTRAAP